MDLFVTRHGSTLSKTGEVLVVTNDIGKLEYSLRDIESIVITGNANVTTSLMKEAIEKDIDIILVDEYGYPKGRIWGNGASKRSKIKKGQLLCSQNSTGLELAKEWIIEKISNMNAHISELTRGPECKKLIEFQEAIKKETDASKIRGYEGNATRYYFSIISKFVPQEFRFTKRSFRPALDEFNALLNYFLGILYNKVEKFVILGGMDPNFGFFHRDDYNRASFVFDLIEKYRDIAYRRVLKLFRENKVRKSYFNKKENEVILNDTGKKELIPFIFDDLNKTVLVKGKRIKKLEKIQKEIYSIGQYFLSITA